MSFPEGTADFTRTAILDGGDHGDVLGLTTDGEPTMFYFDRLLADLQMDVAVNLDNFDGVIMFVHSVMDADNFRFTAVGNGQMRIGRSENGDLYMLDTKEFTPTGWLTYRVVASDDHFRSYADEALVAHGHGPAALPGPAGIRLNGKGTVLLDFMSVQPLGAETPADDHDEEAAGPQDPS
jgi:hypothetical protein